MIYSQTFTTLLSKKYLHQTHNFFIAQIVFRISEIHIRYDYRKTRQKSYPQKHATPTIYPLYIPDLCLINSSGQNNWTRVLINNLKQ